MSDAALCRYCGQPIEVASVCTDGTACAPVVDRDADTMIPCAACSCCKLCSGSHMTTVAANAAWIAENVAP